MSSNIDKDQIRDILTTIARVSRGDYETRIHTSGRHTEFDSIAAGLNMMINEIRSRQKDLEEQQKKIAALNENLVKEIDDRQQAESLYKSLAENTTAGIYIVQDNKFVFFNDSFILKNEYSEEELLSMNPAELVHPEDREMVRESATEMLKGNRTQPYEFRIIAKSGRILWSMETVASIEYKGKRATLGNFVDITERKEIEETLRFSDAAFKSIQDGIYAMDNEYNVTFWNDRCEEIFGISPSDAVGSFIGDLLVMEEEYDGQNAERMGTIDERGYTAEERIYVCPRGRVWVDARVRTMEQDGVRYGWVALVNDVSKRRELEETIRENEEKFSSLFYANPVPMAIFSFETGIITDVNSAYEKYYGYTREECIGTNIDSMHDYVYDEERERLIEMSSEDGIIDGCELTIRLRSGEIRTMVLSTAAMTVGGVPYYISATSDITEQKNVEKQIQETNKQLDAQNEKLHAQAEQLLLQQQELVMKNKEVERANQLKSEFLASMSHELRTPLNAVIGFSELMLDGITGELNDEQKECLNDIQNSGQHLLELINDVLDLSKVEVGKMEFKPVNLDITEVAHEAVQTVRPLTEEREHTVTINIDKGLPQVYADKSRLRQVLLNMLSNATKFTPRGGLLEISASVKGGMCEVRVKDNGIGLKKEDQERIFEVFTQAEAIQDETPKGTGLGLALTRQFLHAMGGEVWVESEYGKGSTFIFTLPLAEPAEVETETVKEKTAKPDKTVVKPNGRMALIIDDDNKARRLLSAWLTEEKYRIAEASGADEGLQMAEELQPDIIILDILMPEKDGWYALRELKSKQSTSKIPVVIASSSGGKDLALGLGAVDYFNKPINKKRFQQRINELGIKKSDKVLIVDDNPADIRLVSSILEAEGIGVLQAEGGKEGIEIILKEKPSLIVLDIMMPDLTGFEVIEQLREMEEVDDIPIIVVTSKDLTNEELDYLKKQTEGIVKKASFSRQDFVDTVKKLVESKL